MSSNVAAVEALYKAFGEGNIPFILDSLADKVKWDHTHNQGHGIPVLVPRNSRDEIGAFFQLLADKMDFQVFEVKKLFDGGEHVMAWLEVKYVHKDTKKEFHDEHCCMLWEFDEAGKVAAFTHVVDTHAEYLAWN
ncbi:hypothetical protein JKP88DRAFT_283815 [Tribonema minus]|uniref:SnoaL-like domain-containing protein n=1 Tax=Tribonema minus TaxID=303371 RepID=A0A835YH99_9STRA|nr:hypothetical protein JKP88DRAFT_283815 [Tribonema minus]